MHMPLENIFNASTTESCIARLEKLTAETKPQWGKMNAPQMLAHLNVPYDMTYVEINPKFNVMTKLLLKWFVKPGVVGEKPYKKNSRTAPVFFVEGDRDFELEKSRLIENIKKTEQLGKDHFEGRDYVSFGKMTATEWSNLFYKHLDHHFTQFDI